MNQYVAFLRGINVGGKNTIKMTELRSCFEGLGFEAVTTYIQSGNVLFRSEELTIPKLSLRIEKALSKAFNYQASVVLRSQKQLQTVIGSAPEGFGASPARYRYDVIFLKEPLTPSEALKTVPTKPGVDQVYSGKGVLYFSRLTRKASQSRLSRITSMPIYQSMTIRNWNTTTALLKLMNEFS